MTSGTEQTAQHADRRSPLKAPRAGQAKTLADRLIAGERPQLVVSGFGHLDVSALVRPLSRRVVRGSQMSAILAVPVPIEVMAMARAGGADGC